MKINLRKASVIQDALKSEISSISKSIVSSITLNIFDDELEEKLQRAQDKVTEGIEKVTRYSDARRFVRAKVAQLNVEVGIAKMLAEEAMLESQEQHLSSITSSGYGSSLSTIKRHIENMLNLAKSGSSQHQLSTKVLSESFIEETESKLNRIKHRRRQLKDRMVAINVKTDFELPADVEATLKELGLLGGPKADEDDETEEG
jgi:hypothetical protein